MTTRDTIAGFPSLAAAPWGEQQLAGELRAGSVEAFNYLISIYSQPLYRFVARLLGDGNDAADVVQDVFLKIFRSAAQFEGKSSLKTWMYQIALHETSNHRRWWRRHKRQETSLDDQDEPGGAWSERLPDSADSPLHLALRGEVRERIQRALGEVAEPFHTVLVLREIEGFRYDEIAEIMGVRIGTVKSRLLRGRDLLRAALLAVGESGPATLGKE